MKIYHPNQSFVVNRKVRPPMVAFEVSDELGKLLVRDQGFKSGDPKPEVKKSPEVLAAEKRAQEAEERAKEAEEKAEKASGTCRAIKSDGDVCGYVLDPEKGCRWHKWEGKE